MAIIELNGEYLEDFIEETTRRYEAAISGETESNKRMLELEKKLANITDAYDKEKARRDEHSYHKSELAKLLNI